jgi:hypothetical protein
MQVQNNQQRLFWSVSKPLKYLGLTVDEWCVSLIFIVPGFILLNDGNITVGLGLCAIGLFMCFLFKKYKKLSQSFKLKSFLIAKKFIPAPKYHPKLLKKNRVGK